MVATPIGPGRIAIVVSAEAAAERGTEMGGQSRTKAERRAGYVQAEQRARQLQAELVRVNQEAEELGARVEQLEKDKAHLVEQVNDLNNQMVSMQEQAQRELQQRDAMLAGLEEQVGGLKGTLGEAGVQ